MDGRKLEALKAKLALRREGAEKVHAILLEAQRRERATLAAAQLRERSSLRAGYLEQTRQIKAERALHKATGLAALLGRVTGVSPIIRKLQRYRDRKRFTEFRERQHTIVGIQKVAAHNLRERHRRQAVDSERGPRLRQSACARAASMSAAGTRICRR